MSRSYKTIFSSSFLIGGQQILRLGIGLLQTKVIAALLGASGTGLFGIYAAMLTFAQHLSGLGLNGSGVRQIARAEASGDRAALKLSIGVLLSVSLLSGALGSLGFFLMRDVLGRMTFGESGKSGDIGILALSICPAVLTLAMLAVLQGLRRLRDMALANVLGAFLGSGLVIWMVYHHRHAAVAPAFLVAAMSTLLAAAVFLRRLPPDLVERVRGSSDRGRAMMREAREQTALGMAFMVKAALLSLAAYVLRLMVVRGLGMEAAGLYHASWMMTMFVTEIILQAIGTDFLPRLSARVHRPGEANIMINEQTESGMLMVSPAILCLLPLAPWVLRLLYAPEFVPATSLARWMLLGTFLRTLAWPLTFLPLAQGRSRLAAGLETFFVLLLLAFAWLGMRWRGLEGMGIGFSAATFCHLVILWRVCRGLTGFSWSRSAVFTFIPGFSCVAVIFMILVWVPGVAGTVAALGVAVAASLGCMARSLRLIKL